MSHPLQAALVNHQRGRLDEARPLYEAFLQEHPDHPDALNLLGVLLLQQGAPQEAVQRLRRAAMFKPTDSGLLNNLGNALRAIEDHVAAADAWRKAVAIDPSNADAWCNLGVASIEAGNGAEAASSWRKALALNPQHIDALNMLAVYLNEAGQIAEAMDHWRTAHRIAPGHHLIAENLAAALQQQALRHLEGNRPQRAEKALAEVTTLRPEEQKGWVMLADARQRQGKLRDAFAAYQRALSINEAVPEIHHNIGNLLKESGQEEQAIRAFRRALALGSTHPATQHALAALTGETTSSSPEAVVRDLFDTHAENFDAHLTETLGYQTPTHLRALYGDQPIQRMLDLGCGTGLSGQAFADIATHITGVDLSPNMLARAREKGVYATLEEGELLTFLQRPGEPYDLIVAADVFVYLGDLGPVLTQAAARLRPGGQILFSVERHSASDGFMLQKSERFAHSDGYIQRTAAEAGLVVHQHSQRNLRQDAGVWVEGTLYLLKQG